MDKKTIGYTGLLFVMLVFCVLIGLTFGLVFNTDLSTYEVIYFERPIYKTDPVQNYSNNEVRTAITYSIRYVCNEYLFKDEHYPDWLLWKDYESRVTNASYNYWIMCYAFNI